MGHFLELRVVFVGLVEQVRDEEIRDFENNEVVADQGEVFEELFPMPLLLIGLVYSVSGQVEVLPVVVDSVQIEDHHKKHLLKKFWAHQWEAEEGEVAKNLVEVEIL